MGKLLVVDDDEALRRLMRLELSDGYEVIDSGEPEQGLAIALESKPDAILLDLRMPRYSGYELLQTFTSFSHTQRIPVIIVSGEAGGQTKEHCKQLGAAGYFEKPIDFDALRACLRQVVAKNSKVTPRSEVRVRLHVPLKLRGTNAGGNKFEELATTENVSLSGFLCLCTAPFTVNSTLDVYLTNPPDMYVGKARVIHSDSQGTKLRRYGCVFIEKSGPWVLQ
jgi:two-component system, OmpR family, response regulator